MRRDILTRVSDSQQLTAQLVLHSRDNNDPRQTIPGPDLAF